MEPLHQSRWARISAKVHAFLRDQRGVRYFFMSLISVLLVGGVLLAVIKPEVLPFADLTITPKKPEPPRYYSPLTGVEVKNEKVTKQAVTAIMIENSPNARPQSGLKESGVVFEAIAEGGITRFIAFYQEAKPTLIGPVRSVRPYYLSWAKPFDASIAHIGGSFNALKEVRSGQYRDIDQFFNADAYWRASDRYAPHNVYTNFQRLDALNASKGYKTSKFTGFVRQSIPKKNQPSKDPQFKTEKATSVNIQISSPLYNVAYKYDAKNGVYHRILGGAPHMDREKGLITPKVAIVMKVKTVIGWEDGYREQMTTTGSGDAYIFQNGRLTRAGWHKKDKNSQIHFMAGGKDIPLARGQTWITAIPTDRAVAWQ